MAAPVRRLTAGAWTVTVHTPAASGLLGTPVPSWTPGATSCVVQAIVLVAGAAACALAAADGTKAISASTVPSTPPFRLPAFRGALRVSASRL
ncbi:hypothetical protein [Streptomyces acidicola]|uniref:hypothetical protein n=1 Tax=Streptomyces acidicola TaxID=2596892 RepID=UPI0037FE86C7